MTTAVLLQARLGSNRLPHKVLLNLNGKTVLEQAMLRLSHVRADLHAVLTDSQSFDVIREIATMGGWECFQGPSTDVLARYIFAARHYGVDTIIRATADNPLVSFELANILQDAQRQEPVDYRVHVGIPYGAGVEVIRATSLEQAIAQSSSPYDHEHVTPYLYNNPTLFRIKREYAPAEFLFPDLRITLDNEEDYRFLFSLYRNYGLGSLPRLPYILKTMYPIAV